LGVEADWGGGVGGRFLMMSRLSRAWEINDIIAMIEQWEAAQNEPRLRGEKLE
jgi:hypothetical protein